MQPKTKNIQALLLWQWQKTGRQKGERWPAVFYSIYQSIYTSLLRKSCYRCLPLHLNRSLYWKCKKKLCMWVKRCWNNEFIFQILCTDSWKTHQLKLNRKNTSVLTVREDGRQHFINSIQWKQSLATRNLKAIFLVEWQGNMRSLYSKDEKNQNKKTHYNY